MAKSCQLDTTFTYEVVSSWHDLPHICNFFDNDPILVKTKKKDPMMVIKPVLNGVSLVTVVTMLGSSGTEENLDQFV